MSNQNMTDYTQIGQSVSTQEVILSKTYKLLALSFLPCAAGAVVGMFFNPFLMLFATNFWVGVLAFFGFFYGMCFLIEKNRYSNVGVALLMVFTFGMGMMLTPVLAIAMQGGAGGKLVATAAVMTAAIFFAMAAMARRANINTMALGNFLAIGAIVLMIGVVANLFLQLSVLSLALAGLFVIFSSLLIMWQVKSVIEGGEDSHISAALTIFIAIYNLFTSLLRILMALSGND